LARFYQILYLFFAYEVVFGCSSRISDDFEGKSMKNYLISENFMQLIKNRREVSGVQVEIGLLRMVGKLNPTDRAWRVTDGGGEPRGLLRFARNEGIGTRCDGMKHLY